MLMRDGRLATRCCSPAECSPTPRRRRARRSSSISYRLATDVAHGRQPSDVVGDTLLFQGQPRQVVGVLKAEVNDRARRAIMPVAAVSGAVVVGAVRSAGAAGSHGAVDRGGCADARPQSSDGRRSSSARRGRIECRS